MNELAVELVPHALDSERVLANHKRRNVGVDDVGRLPVDGPRQAADALIGLNRDEDRRDRIGAARVALLPEPAARNGVAALVLVLRVDVDGTDDALFPQLAVVLELALKLNEPHASDAHGGVQVRPVGRE